VARVGGCHSTYRSIPPEVKFSRQRQSTGETKSGTRSPALVQKVTRRAKSRKTVGVNCDPGGHVESCGAEPAIQAPPQKRFTSSICIYEAISAEQERKLLWTHSNHRKRTGETKRTEQKNNKTTSMTRQKILLVDDDPAVLSIYQELLGQLPSNPEIHTALSGPRALAMLDSDAYRLLACDLSMPKMDGLQVLSIVRRKHPQVRTMALTGVADEQFRSRVYSLGVDLYWHKPGTEEEIRLFIECIESLLGQEDSGFRGLQSKSLMDIIQMECMSQNSTLLCITNGTTPGRIWIQDGEVIDAETGDLRGEQAFLRIFSWENGSFETQQPEPSRPRTIFKSYNALLLESAQALDELRDVANQPEAQKLPARPGLSEIEGLEFVVAIDTTAEKPVFARGIENPSVLADWTRKTIENFQSLGEQLHAGGLSEIEASGTQRQLTLTSRQETQFCIASKNNLERAQARETVLKVLNLWDC
jgi:CheY-like chemotaxis protein